jgi:hypothetical protein
MAGKKQVKPTDMLVLSNYYIMDGKHKVAKSAEMMMQDCERILPGHFINFNGQFIDCQYFSDGTFEKIVCKDHYDMEAALFRAGIYTDFANKKTCEFAISWRSFAAILRDSVLPRYTRESQFASVPPIPNELIWGEEIKPEKTGYLERLIAYFNPLTPHDRDLMLALAMTPVWGGLPGSRPLFVVAGEDGLDSTVKIGKSKFSEAIQRLYKSQWDMHADSNDAAKMIDNMLTVCQNRVVRLDNVTQNIPTRLLERTITSPFVFGHKFHKGHRQIPNYATWIITANMPQITEDLATRAQVVRLARPTHGAAWAEEHVWDFIENERKLILADVYYLLSEPDVIHGNTLSRFPSWEKSVLNKVMRAPLEYAKKFKTDHEILSRDAANTEADDYRDFCTEFVQNYKEPLGACYNVSPESHQIFVTSQMMHYFYEVCFKRNVAYSSKTARDIRQLAEKSGFVYADRVRIKANLFRGFYISRPAKMPRAIIKSKLNSNSFAEIY